MKKRVFIIFVMLIQNNLFANSNKANIAEQSANEYTKEIQDNNGSLKVSKGVYLQSVTYTNNELKYQLLYNKDELIREASNRRNISIEEAKKNIESKKFKDNILRKQKANNVISYCNPNNDSMTKLVREGLKITINAKWDDNTTFINYTFSQKVCDELVMEYKKKREKERKK